MLNPIFIVPGRLEQTFARTGVGKQRTEGQNRALAREGCARASDSRETRGPVFESSCATGEGPGGWKRHTNATRRITDWSQKAVKGGRKAVTILNESAASENSKQS